MTSIESANTFVEQIKAAAPDKRQCGSLCGLFDALKIVWRTLFQPREVTIEQVTRSMLRNREVSPSALRWFSDRTITKIFSNISSDDVVMAEAGKCAAIDARAAHTRAAIIDVFRKTFTTAVTIIERYPTREEQRWIESALLRIEQAFEREDHATITHLLDALARLTSIRTLAASDEAHRARLQHIRPDYVLEELRDVMPRGVDQLIAHFTL